MLDHVEICGREGCLKEGAAICVVELDEERPVDEPCARVELGQGGWFGRCEEGRRGPDVRVLSSLRATSHLLVRMLEASLPQCITVLFSPNDEQSRRIQDRITHLAKQEKENLVLAETNKRWSNILVDDIKNLSNLASGSAKSEFHHLNRGLHTYRSISPESSKKTKPAGHDIDDRLNEMLDLIQDLSDGAISVVVARGVDNRRSGWYASLSIHPKTSGKSKKYLYHLTCLFRC